MKVFNLQCGSHHQFEGWFGSEDDYVNQLDRGLLVCPMCGDKAVHKLPSAPRLNLGATAQADTSAPEASLAMGPEARALQAAYLKLARHVLDQTEDVGPRFAEEARKIHYGEADERGIRGQASREETEALIDEGIAVMPLPLPEGFNGPLQ